MTYLRSRNEWHETFIPLYQGTKVQDTKVPDAPKQKYVRMKVP